MVKRIRGLCVVTLVLATLVLVGRPTFAQSDNPGEQQLLVVYQTGHTVQGDFLKTYLSVPNQDQVFGLPITEQFFSPSSDRLVQYFQKARFELFPENPIELRVRITPLGELLHTPGQALPLPANFPSCRKFPETGTEVCYKFLEFFMANGGVPVLGYPISNFEIQDNLIVQSFQKARMEWHPENEPGQRVTLTNLGRKYFDFVKEDARLLLPVLDNNSPHLITHMKVRAFPARAVLPRTGIQTIYVIVQDQNNQPVSNAEASIEVKLPSQNIFQEYSSNPSDANGIIQFILPYQGERPGLVEIQVKVFYTSLPNAKTTTSFRIWW